MASIDLRQRLRDLLEGPIRHLGYDLVAVEWLSDPRGRVLRLSIDAPGGVGIDDCSRVSHLIDPILEEADPIEGSYRLEVSSPGIERPVQRLQDWARFVGFRVRLRLGEGHPRRRFTGQILGVDGDVVRIEADGTEHRLHVEAIEKAHLHLDLETFQRLADEGLPPIPVQEPPGAPRRAPAPSERQENDDDQQ